MSLGTLGHPSVCEVEHQSDCLTVSQPTSHAAAAARLSVGSRFHSCFISDRSTVINVTAGVSDRPSMTKPLIGQEEVLGERILDFPSSFPNPVSNWQNSMCQHRSYLAALYVPHHLFAKAELVYTMCCAADIFDTSYIGQLEGIDAYTKAF